MTWLSILPMAFEHLIANPFWRKPAEYKKYTVPMATGFAGIIAAWLAEAVNTDQATALAVVNFALSVISNLTRNRA